MGMSDYISKGEMIDGIDRVIKDLSNDFFDAKTDKEKMEVERKIDKLLELRKEKEDAE